MSRMLLAAMLAAAAALGRNGCAEAATRRAGGREQPVAMLVNPIYLRDILAR